MGALGLTLGDLVALRAAATNGSRPVRSVILLWLWGGPSHLDTFDMKPDAPIEYRGPFEPIATAVPGMNLCELLPGLARRADKFALLRAMHHESNDHGVAGTIALTGSIAGAVGLGGPANTGSPRPSTGAIVGRLHRGEAGSLPPYVILGKPFHQGLKRAVGEGGGAARQHVRPVPARLRARRRASSCPMRHFPRGSARPGSGSAGICWAASRAFHPDRAAMARRRA